MFYLVFVFLKRKNITLGCVKIREKKRKCNFEFVGFRKTEALPQLSQTVVFGIRSFPAFSGEPNGGLNSTLFILWHAFFEWRLIW